VPFLQTHPNTPKPPQGLRERYETHHKLRYTDEALMAAAKYSSQYISDRFLPDKAIDLIDEAGSRVRLRHIQLPEEARELDKELKQVWAEGGGEL
jgi:ATP-dependent Clp protease ATP-binding subunit ClpC